MTPFQHLLIWKYCVVFGTFFNDIVIQRGNEATPDVQMFKVPIEFGPKEKFLAMTNAKPTDHKIKAIQLPRMSYEMTGMSFDASRKLAREKIISSDNNLMLRGAPWNINFRLSIMSKNLLDATKIVEQVLFMFQPDYTVDVKLIQNFSHLERITTDFVAISHADEYEGNFESVRKTVWDIDFVMKAWLYGPVGEGKRIKKINLDYHPSYELGSDAEKTIIIPGLTADGEPTTDITKTIPYQQIEMNDNFDIIVQNFPLGPEESDG